MTRYAILPHPDIKYRKEGCVRVYDTTKSAQGASVSLHKNSSEIGPEGWHRYPGESKGDFFNASHAQLYVDMVLIGNASIAEYNKAGGK